MAMPGAAAMPRISPGSSGASGVSGAAGAVWPGKAEGDEPDLRLSEVVEALLRTSRLEGPRLVERWLDRLDASGRYALLKLVTGELRIGVTARLAKQALARLGDKDVVEIEEIHRIRDGSTYDA